MRDKSSSADWSFADPKDVAAFTTTQILKFGKPILRVSHDQEDGAWQFHSGEIGVSESDAMVVSLSEMVDHDPSLRELADLPIGWFAKRSGVTAPWKRAPQF